MTGEKCPNCGAALKPGGQYCAHCGTAIPQPLASSVSPEPRAGGPPDGPAPALVGTPASRRAKSRALLVAVVVIIVIVAGIGGYIYFGATQNVKVGFFVAQTSDNVCGLGRIPTAWAGFNGAPGTSESVQLFQVPNYNLTSCTLRGVTTATSGFTISGVQLPGPISGSPNPNQPSVGYLNFTLALPGSSWSGNVSLTFF